MIAYNMRYRGPMEYDKFVLNFLQYYNEINEVFYEEFQNGENRKAYQKLHNDIDSIFAVFVGTDSKKGINEQLQHKLILMREV